MDYKFKIVIILTIGFALASLLGYLTQRLKLPSILGYLLAGYLIGPYSPGFVADLEVSEQLAEISVILMLFGVGLHFKLEDLIKVKGVAIPGAIGQTLVTTLAGAFFVYAIGWPIEVGLITGLAIGVASTVVLVRILVSTNLIDTLQGHIAVGWLVVEDILTIAVLILLPMFALSFGENTHLSAFMIIKAIVVMLFKFALLCVLMFTWGRKVVSYILTGVARLRSHELFTLTVLALTFLIATGSAVIFGTSIALGAFLAGMIVGQTDVRHQASANALPLQDAFAVIFFLSVGMLFNPQAIVENFTFFIGILAIILILKPLIAFLIVRGLKYPVNIALAVAVALAQIGEFSFILAEESDRLNIFPDTGYDVLVACALVTISLNPLLFRLINPSKKTSRISLSSLISLFKFDAERPKAATFSLTQLKLLKKARQKVFEVFESSSKRSPPVVLIGFGPIGQSVCHALEQMNIRMTIIEQNIDAIPEIKGQKRQVIYGDASIPHILESAHIESAKLLVITVPESSVAQAIIKSALPLNSNLRILARIQYVAEESSMQEMNVDFICSEKELARAFADRAVNLMTHKALKFAKRSFI